MAVKELEREKTAGISYAKKLHIMSTYVDVYTFIYLFESCDYVRIYVDYDCDFWKLVKIFTIVFKCQACQC